MFENLYFVNLPLKSIAFFVKNKYIHELVLHTSYSSTHKFYKISS